MTIEGGNSLLQMKIFLKTVEQIVVARKVAKLYNTLMTFLSGALAQLGERLAGSHEVAGSSPACSISSNLLSLKGFVFLFLS